MTEDSSQEEDGIEEPLENDNAWNWQQVPILDWHGPQKIYVFLASRRLPLTKEEHEQMRK